MTTTDFLDQHPDLTLMVSCHPYVSGIYIARAVTVPDCNCTGHFTCVATGTGSTPDDATDDLVRTMRLAAA